MRVMTTILLALFEQPNEDQNSAIASVDLSPRAEEIPVELIGIYRGRNRVIVIERTEE